MSNKPKLAIIVNSFYSFGGGERWAIELSKKIKDDFGVTLIHQVMEGEVDSLERIEFDKSEDTSIKLVKITCYGKQSNQFGYNYIFRIPTFAGFYRLAKTIKNSDVIYQVSFNPLIFSFSVFVAKIFGKRLIIGIHNPTFPNLFKKDNTALESLEKLYFKFILRFADAFHVLNRRDMLLVKHNLKKKVYLIPNPLFEKVSPKILSTQSKKFVVLFVGRLAVRDKGVDMLKQIIEKTVQIDKKIEFRIIGLGEGGDLVNDLVHRYPNNVKQLGFISYNKVKVNYMNSNLLIMPSRIEAFPFVVLEAQSFGLPVVAFNIPGPKDIISPRKTGELVSPFNVGKFVDKIISYDNLWRNDPKKYYIIKQNVFDITNKKYDSNKIISELKKLIAG